MLRHKYLLIFKKQIMFFLDFFFILFFGFYLFYLKSFNNIFLHSILSLVFLGFFLFINIFPSPYTKELKSKQLRIIADGNILLKIFLGTTSLSIIFFLFSLFTFLPELNFKIFLHSWLFKYSFIVFLIELILFWNGMIRILLFSTQLGIKMRFIACICGMIPLIHLIVLSRMLLIIDNEVAIENNRFLVDEKRKNLKICQTKYPILMVHGIFFRDFKKFNYWGRIPGELIKNGAQIFYGNHQSATPIQDAAQELKKRVLEILQQTGAQKINIIAHSKGGLDSRYMISKLGMENYIASLTTINTPHRGCEFADFLLNKIPEKKQNIIAKTYNNILRNLGDTNPDFLPAVKDLTAESCRNFNKEVLDSKKVYYQSVGSKLNLPTGGRFPLNFSFYLVNEFDGDNDGLVGENSCSWGEKFQFVTTYGKRGISHGDMIDLNRENFDGFDVQDFFVNLVNDLREKGF